MDPSSDPSPCHLSPGLAAAAARRVSSASLLAIALLAPASAMAGTATNVRAGISYGTLAAAIADALPNDQLELSGTFQESVVVDRSLTLVGGAGATLAWHGGNLIEVAGSVDLIIDGLVLDGTGNTRGILASEGDNRLIVRNSTFSTGSPVPGEDGGGIYIADPRLLVVDTVVFAGEGERWASRGGAVFATATETAPALFVDVEFNGIRSGQGGGIWSFNLSLTCLRCSFLGTRSGFGGGIYAAFASLRVEQSLFCGTHGSLGGGVFSSADTDIRSSVFVEGTSQVNGSAVYGNGGDWSFVNNHVLAMGGTSAVYISILSTALEVTNNLLVDNLGTALSGPGAGPPAHYNWLQGNAVHASFALDSSNFVDDGDPRLVEWSRDGDCSNDSLWPTPLWSPLRNSGDPDILNPDGSRSDIGAFGGERADPSFHLDHDGDGDVFLDDCDDAEPTMHLGAVEVCDALDNDCDGHVDNDPIDIDSFHVDCDSDGQGAPVASFVQCFEPLDPPACGASWLSFSEHGPAASSDCDDTDPDAYLGAPESCDPGDQSCDGDPDLGAVDAFAGFTDADLDGFGAAPEQSCTPLPIPGLSDVGGDCDDSDGSVNPAALEVADGIDNDCDGVVDFDSDGDGIEDARDNCLLAQNPDQTDANRDGYGNICDADYDDDGDVDLADLSHFVGAYGSGVGGPDFDPAVDANGDGAIGRPDLNILAALFGKPPGPSGLTCAGTVGCP